MQIALRKVFIGSIMVKYDMPRFVNASSPINGGRRKGGMSQIGMVRGVSLHWRVMNSSSSSLFLGYGTVSTF